MKKKIFGYVAGLLFVALVTVVLNLENSGYHSDDDNAQISQFSESELNIIAFTSPYCSACKNQEKIVNTLQSEITEGAQFDSVDVTKNRFVADHYQVAVVPTLVITRFGIEVERFTGNQSEPDIKKVIERELGKKHCSDGTLC